MKNLYESPEVVTMELSVQQCFATSSANNLDSASFEQEGINYLPKLWSDEI